MAKIGVNLTDVGGQMVGNLLGWLDASSEVWQSGDIFRRMTAYAL
jgi:hypothetical protein